jgi:choice-of-anchor B domain-containing protein
MAPSTFVSIRDGVRLMSMVNAWYRTTALAMLGAALAASGSKVLADAAPGTGMQSPMDARSMANEPLAPLHGTPCVNGMAGIYPCSNVDLLAFVPLSTFSASGTSGIWGWTDTQTGIEYALVGASNGLAMFNLAQPDHPVYLGKLPTQSGSSSWRDVRVYANHAYVVSDNNGAHGMQVFNLALLRGVTTPQTFTATRVISDFGRGHTLSINEATGFAYVAGSEACTSANGSGALRMYNLQAPALPVFVGCIPVGGYTHEAQCWTYSGPDVAHAGKEICFNANGPTDRIAVVDVSNKAAPVTLSSTTYVGAAYPHQGWLTPDQRYYLLNDEFDESNNGHNARTYVFDVANLDAPLLVGYHEHPLPVTDHNLYVHGGFVYESNYEAGLRILELGNLSQAEMTEVAFFDTLPGSQRRGISGNWGNYRFPGSGNVIATGIDEGLFVLQPHLCPTPATPQGLSTSTGVPHRIDISWTSPGGNGPSWRVERAQGGCAGVFQTVADGLVSPTFADTTVSGQVPYGYRVRQKNADGACYSSPSVCVTATTTGTCTAAPLFTGVANGVNAGTATCRVDLSWPAAQPACGGPARYSVYRGSSSDFLPSLANRIASGLSGTSFTDSVLDGVGASHFIVRATDIANGSEEGNRTVFSIQPTGPLFDGTFSTGAEPGDPRLDSGDIVAGDASRSIDPDAVRHAGWHMSQTRVHQGTQSFWSTSANNLCVSLVSPSLTLTAGQSPRLSFFTAWDTEASYDGGVIEISVNGGGSWTRLTPVGGYPSTINNGGTLCGIAQGSGAYTGPAHFAWTPVEVNLSAYAGQSVQLRWLYRTDSNTLGEGWYVDDIAISHAQVPGVCVSSEPPLFRNGFE